MDTEYIYPLEGTTTINTLPYIEPDDVNHYRAIFLSDVHLGTRGCQAELLLDFLKHNDADTWYLVGDILDGWVLKSRWYFPQSHNDVIQKLLKKVRKGAQMILVPGNHDEFARHYLDMNFGGVEVKDPAYHIAADGRRFLIIHGDQFDCVVQNMKWIAYIGDIAYNFSVWANRRINKVRSQMGLSYWSLSAWLKSTVKEAVNFIGSFEDVVVSEAHRHKVDGIICGHIHHCAIKEMRDITYINTGDWVESCTAIAETYSGEFKILQWEVT